MKSLEEKLTEVSELGGQESSGSEDLVRTSFDDTISDFLHGRSNGSFQEGRIDHYAYMNNNKPGGDSVVAVQSDVVIEGEDLFSSVESLDQGFLSDEEDQGKKSKETNTNSFLSLVACFGCIFKDKKPKIKASELSAPASGSNL